MEVIFGLGTGRCGTHSLTHLLNSQENSNVSHEIGGIPFLPWEPSKGTFMHGIGTVGESGSDFVGDVAFYWLPYVHDILEIYPNAKFVVLKRDRQAVIDSYMKWTPTRNHWKNHMGIEWIECPWDNCFPTYSLDLTKEEAIGKYWDDYYIRVDILKRIYPDHLLIFPTEHLNEEDKVQTMLEWCGFKNIKPISNIRLART
jgi:hypothetical protein